MNRKFTDDIICDNFSGFLRTDLYSFRKYWQVEILINNTKVIFLCTFKLKFSTTFFEALTSYNVLYRDKAFKATFGNCLA